VASPVPHPLPSWWDEACDYRYGILPSKPRPKDIPHLTRPQYDWCFEQWAEFDAWNTWKDKGGPRPAVWHLVPLWAWRLRHELLHAHPKPPKPPPAHPEPVSIWKNPPWKGRGIHIAWGFESGDWTPAQIAARLHKAGFSWAALEGSPALQNEQFMADFVAAQHELGMKAILWERSDVQKDYPEPRLDHVTRLLTTYGFDAYGADIEEFPIDTPDFPTAFANAHPTFPRVTLCAGMADAVYYQTWIAAGWDCMTEAYSGMAGVAPGVGIAGAMDSDAFWRGFPRNAVPKPGLWGGNGTGPHTWPIIEVNAEKNPGLAPQLSAVAPWGDNYSIWDAEQMQDADWAVYGA